MDDAFWLPKSQIADADSYQDGDENCTLSITPWVAKQKGLDLAAIAGSGPHGRIILRDVETAVPSAGTARRAPPVAATPAEPPKVRSLEQMGIPPGTYDLKPLDGMKNENIYGPVPHF